MILDSLIVVALTFCVVMYKLSTTAPVKRLALVGVMILVNSLLLLKGFGAIALLYSMVAIAYLLGGRVSGKDEITVNPVALVGVLVIASAVVLFSLEHNLHELVPQVTNSNLDNVLLTVVSENKELLFLIVGSFFVIKSAVAREREK
jgi:hypothetical protein